jgi:hypothetical protein
MEQEQLSSMSQVGVVNGATIVLMVMDGVMWGYACWYVSRYFMFAN